MNGIRFNLEQPLNKDHVGISMESLNQPSSAEAWIEPPYFSAMLFMLFIPKPWKLVSALLVRGRECLNRMFPVYLFSTNILTKLFCLSTVRCISL